MALTPDQREELEILRALRDRPNFERFVLTHFPELGPVPRALRPLYRLIDESRRRPVRARVSMPPRFGKTTTFKAAVCYRMAFDPACLNIYVASGDGLATDFGIATRRMARRAGVALSADRTNAHHFATPYGGGLKSVGLFGDLVGRGCNGGIIVADDLLRSRSDAESKLIRDKTYSSLVDDVFSRLEEGASLFLNATRWHEDDPHGRIARDPIGEQWDEVIIPAVTAPDGTPTDSITDDCIALCPERGFDLDWARKAFARNPYGFWSLYQQQPRPRGGQMFSEPARFDLASFAVDGWRLVMVLDPAATAKTSSDYSAGGVLAMRGSGDTAEARVIDRFRVQEPLPRVFGRCMELHQRFGIPLHVEGVGGFAALPDLARSIVPSLPVIVIPSSMMRGGKFERATPLSVAWNDPAGRFAVPMGSQWDDYIDEFRDFSGVNDAHDDQVDWTAHAFNLGSRQDSSPPVTLSLPSTFAWQPGGGFGG